MTLPLTWKLVGWLACVTVYFVCNDGYRWPSESIKSVCLKILPILQCLYIALTSQSPDGEFPRFRKCMAYGLALSTIGDALLVFENHTILGAIAFAIAHVCYISGLGLVPFGGICLLASFIMVGAGILFRLFVHVGVLTVLGCSLYLMFVLCVAWRAAVRYLAARSAVNLCGCVGAMLFVLSDSTLLYEVFVEKLPHSSMPSMAAYYTAQLGLTMMTTDGFTPIQKTN